MIEYKVYKLTPDEIGERCPEIVVDGEFTFTYIYVGFWDNDYVGFMAGTQFKADTIDIQRTFLNPKYRGSKIVRILREILRVIHKDYKVIHVRVNNDNNDMLKVLLSAGFHVIGMRGNCVELERRTNG